MIPPAELFRRAARHSGVAFLDGRAARPGASLSHVAWDPTTSLEIDGDGTARIDGRALEEAPLEAIGRFSEEQQASGRTVIGALAYDLGGWIEPRAGILRGSGTLAHLSAYSRCHSFDHLTKRWTSPVPDLPPAFDSPIRLGPLRLAISRAAYDRSFAQILSWIRAGDIYQANLSIRFDAEASGPPELLYERFASCQPVPYGACLRLGDRWILSNSPELFLARRGRQIMTRPIKGTRPRGGEAQTDRVLRHELRGDPKELAEHVMIVDLERNDLGRIARTGSVRVGPLEEIESYATLHHLASTVSAELCARLCTGDSGSVLAEALRATFPGGSITGAPKIRAMQILAGLEGESRGFYTGAILHLPPGGDFTMSLCIRTATLEGGNLCYRAGGGLVADSSAASEWEECLLKSRALFLAETP